MRRWHSVISDSVVRKVSAIDCSTARVEEDGRLGTLRVERPQLLEHESRRVEVGAHAQVEVCFGSAGHEAMERSNDGVCASREELFHLLRLGQVTLDAHDPAVALVAVDLARLDNVAQDELRDLDRLVLQEVLPKEIAEETPSACTSALPSHQLGYNAVGILRCAPYL